MMQRKAVIRVTSKLLIPFILLFALYVQWHGDFGPGGGFQAGVIFGAGFILYAGVGYAGLFLGGRYLNYSVLAETQTSGQHIGILLVEFGVGMTVAAAMVTIFFAFAGQEEEEHGAEWD